MTATSQNSLPPFGKYASWAFSISIFTGILAILGSLAGGGGGAAGTAVALILNPFCWLAIWFWFKSTKITCPHCGAGVPLTAYLQTQPVGSILRCSQCRNDFLKPAMSGQTGHVTNPVRVQPVPVRPAEPFIHEVPRSAGVEVLLPSVRVVEPKPKPMASELERADDGSSSMLPIVARTEQESRITQEEAEPKPDPVILRVDGTSTFLTLKEHQRRGWKEATRCDLSNMTFRGVSFAGANLEGAKLDGSEFSGCSFRNAILAKVSAQHSDFEGADFSGAKLLQADFQDSNLKKAIFCSVNGSDVVPAEFDQVNFGRCKMSEAVFVPVPPKGSGDVGTSTVRRTLFSGSDMSRCDLQGTDFRTCKFTDTSLFGASLQRCNLEGVDLGSANLINANLNQVVFSDSSMFPEGFPLPADAKNMDVIRREQLDVTRRQQEAVEKASRESERILLILAAIFIFVSIVGATLFALLNKAPSTARPSSSATPLPETGAAIPNKNVTEKANVESTAAQTGSPSILSNSIGMDFKLVPAGTFTMGSDSGNLDEKPAHRVTLTNPFYIGVYEVTQDQYEQVMGVNPSQFRGRRQNPVEGVSWDDAVIFCRKLSALLNEKGASRDYRLPTEAEWEYACRAGTTTEYSFGDSKSRLGDFAWYHVNSESHTHPVGQKKSNGWGLHDMYGNVSEWVQTSHADYSNDSLTDPHDTSSGLYPVFRGGDWINSAESCRSACRRNFFSTARLNYLGFRIVMNLPSAALE